MRSVVLAAPPPGRRPRADRRRSSGISPTASSTRVPLFRDPRLANARRAILRGTIVDLAPGPHPGHPGVRPARHHPARRRGSTRGRAWRRGRLWSATSSSWLEQPSDLANTHPRAVPEESTTFSGYREPARRWASSRASRICCEWAHASAPDEATAARIEALDDTGRIEALADRLLEPEVKTWDELLGTSSWRERRIADSMSNPALIGLGSNLGDRAATIAEADSLAAIPAWRWAVSSFHETEPVADPGPGPFSTRRPCSTRP